MSFKSGYHKKAVMASGERFQQKFHVAHLFVILAKGRGLALFQIPIPRLQDNSSANEIMMGIFLDIQAHNAIKCDVITPYIGLHNYGKTSFTTAVMFSYVFQLLPPNTLWCKQRFCKIRDISSNSSLEDLYCNSKVKFSGLTAQRFQESICIVRYCSGGNRTNKRKVDYR